MLEALDEREPFRKNPNKIIEAQGIDELTSYFDSFTDFERILYGANANYRDHVFHIFRTWLLGVYVIISKNFQITLIDGSDGRWDDFGKITQCEIMSMWAIISFCHDLGYPLEKAQGIFKETKKMLGQIVSEPQISTDLSFSRSQDPNNYQIIDFISTKISKNPDNPDSFWGKIQSKYRYKLNASLERCAHGAISALIIYRKLTYFKESDFNLNFNFPYTDHKDVRQFYIRREILRAIAYHTCPDIYNIQISTFPSLLFMCDEMQNWERKNFTDIYSNSSDVHYQLTIEKFSDKTYEYVEEITYDSEDIPLETIVSNVFTHQYCKYKNKFRDAQDSANRDYEIKHTVKIMGTQNTKEATITMCIKRGDSTDSFCVESGISLIKKNIKSITNSIFSSEYTYTKQ